MKARAAGGRFGCPKSQHRASRVGGPNLQRRTAPPGCDSHGTETAETRRMGVLAALVTRLDVAQGAEEGMRRVRTMSGCCRVTLPAPSPTRITAICGRKNYYVYASGGRLMSLV